MEVYLCPNVKFLHEVYFANVRGLVMEVKALRSAIYTALYCKYVFVTRFHPYGGGTANLWGPLEDINLYKRKEF